MGLLKKASSAAKKVTKKIQKATVKSITKPLSKVPGAKNVAQKLEAESMRGIDKYSDMGQDLAANIGTGGAYGAAMAADQALDNPQAFAKGLTSKEGLTNLGSQYAGSQLGVDPSLLKAGAGALQGQSLDPRAMALQAASSYAGGKLGVDPMLAEQGMNVAQGKRLDLQGMGTQFAAQQAGIDPRMAKAIASQDAQGLVASQIPGIDRGGLLKNLTSQDQLQKQFGNLSQIGAGQAKNLLVNAAVSMGVPAAIADKIPADQLQAAIQRGPATIKNLVSNFTTQGTDEVGAEMPKLASKDSGTFFDPLISGAKRLFGGKSDDVRDAQGEYEAMQRKELEDLRNAQGEYEESQQPSMLDKFGREVKRIGGQVKGAIGAVADYNAENPELANAAIGTAAGALAFKQRQDALQAQQKILSEQLEQARRMQTFEQEQPELYKEMVKGGPTSKYAQEMLGTARDAGQIAQSGRSAALERMSRMGRGGGELEAMLSGAQEGANRYAQAGQQAMIRDQDLRLGAQEKLSAIDRFNVGQRQSGQTERVNLEQQLRGQERGYQGTQGQLRAGLTEAGAGAAMEANAAIANRKMIEKQKDMQHKRDMEKINAQKPTQVATISTPQITSPAAPGTVPAKKKPLNKPVGNIV